MNYSKVKDLCDDLARKNRIVLSYAKRLEALNSALTDLLNLSDSDRAVLDDLNMEDILARAIENSDDAKHAVVTALDDMEYIDREVSGASEY
jgi:hypothetical protein